MSDSLDFENGLTSFSNPNYQLEPLDANSELESVSNYNELFDNFDRVCQFNRKPKDLGNSGLLDHESTDTGDELETSAMLSADSDNNLEHNLQSRTFDGKIYQNINNSATDTNDNKGFLQYYISLENSAWCNKENNDAQSDNDFVQSESSNDTMIEKKTAAPKKAVIVPLTQDSDTDNLMDIIDSKIQYLDQQMSNISKSNFHNGTVVQEKDKLPPGWEKHEDESGPYYWHITSGTIQREIPINSSYKNSRLSKDIDLIPGIDELSITSNKLTAPSVLSGQMNCKVPNAFIDNKLKRRSYPEGSCSLTQDNKPIRFAVRSLGWVEIAEEDLTPEKSSKAVNKCIVDLSMGKNDLLDVVGRWGDGKDLFLDLDDYSLRLIDTQDLTVLNAQPIHTIRVWGVGRDNGRDFAYVARDRITRKYMCHVFRCDIPARIIANTLRDICKKIMIVRNLQQSLSKQVRTDQDSNLGSQVANNGGPTRPSNLPTEQRRFVNSECHSSYSGLFPTPMEEPKKVLKVHYLGTTNVHKAMGVDVLNDAIEQLSSTIPITSYKYVNIAVAPSTITVTEPGEDGKILADCRVRFLSFLGIGKNVKYCGFIVHTSEDEFIAHVFYCEPSSGALCKTIEAACKLRYQKCLDAHQKINDAKRIESQTNKGLATTIKNIFGNLGRLTKSVET